VKKNYDNMLSRFHMIPERYGHTDRQTDRIAISISRVSVLPRDKNSVNAMLGQTWTWVGSIHVLDWVGLGRTFSRFGGLG